MDSQHNPNNQILPLRRIRQMADTVLKRLSLPFEDMYAERERKVQVYDKWESKPKRLTGEDFHLSGQFCLQTGYRIALRKR